VPRTSSNSISHVFPLPTMTEFVAQYQLF
jgi:hypothetical protein